MKAAKTFLGLPAITGDEDPASEELEIVKAAGFNLSALSAEQISLFATRILSNGFFRAEWRDPKYRWGLETYPTAADVLRKMTQQQRVTLRLAVERNTF